MFTGMFPLELNSVRVLCNIEHVSLLFQVLNLTCFNWRSGSPNYIATNNSYHSFSSLVNCTFTYTHTGERWVRDDISGCDYWCHTKYMIWSTYTVNLAESIEHGEDNFIRFNSVFNSWVALSSNSIKYCCDDRQQRDTTNHFTFPCTCERGKKVLYVATWFCCNH